MFKGSIWDIGFWKLYSPAEKSYMPQPLHASFYY